ncbi:hypothetical protein HHK36_000462 [Tetracentron sinense]|uniref:MIF4G domain-containing protein n=1 Tax=Tetracentron sinense TaxID=13715 RepID=A0A834ZU49_TETSI|nr:hypothetical protein HHK36_000462 [Tetracentron sinense]
MSINQSRADQGRNFSGGDSTAPPPLPQSIKKSKRRRGKHRVSAATANLESNAVATAHTQSPLHGASDALASGVSAKSTDSFTQRKNERQEWRKVEGPTKMGEIHRESSQGGIQRNNLDADQYQLGTGAGLGDMSKESPLLFGTINPGFMNGMLIPTQTSSDPPHLDEPKHDQGYKNKERRGGRRRRSRNDSSATSLKDGISEPEEGIETLAPSETCERVFGSSREQLPDIHAGITDASGAVTVSVQMGEGSTYEPSNMSGVGTDFDNLDVLLHSKRDDCTLPEVQMKEEIIRTAERRKTELPEGPKQDNINFEMSAGSTYSKSLEVSKQTDQDPSLKETSVGNEFGSVGTEQKEPDKQPFLKSKQSFRRHLPPIEAVGCSSEVERTTDNMVKSTTGPQQHIQVDASNSAGNSKSSLKTSREVAKYPENMQASPPMVVGPPTTISNWPSQVLEHSVSLKDRISKPGEGIEILVPSETCESVFGSTRGQLPDIQIGIPDTFEAVTGSVQMGEGSAYEPSNMSCVGIDFDNLDAVHHTKQDDCTLHEVHLKEDIIGTAERWKTELPEGPKQDNINIEMSTGSTYSESLAVCKQTDQDPSLKETSACNEFVSMGTEQKEPDKEAVGCSSKVERTTDNMVDASDSAGSSKSSLKTLREVIKYPLNIQASPPMVVGLPTTISNSTSHSVSLKDGISEPGEGIKTFAPLETCESLFGSTRQQLPGIHAGIPDASEAVACSVQMGEASTYEPSNMSGVGTDSYNLDAVHRSKRDDLHEVQLKEEILGTAERRKTELPEGPKQDTIKFEMAAGSTYSESLEAGKHTDQYPSRKETTVSNVPGYVGTEQKQPDKEAVGCSSEVERMTDNMVRSTTTVQSLSSEGGIQLNNLDADQWQCATGIEKGVIPSHELSQAMHKAEKKYEVGKVSNMEEAKQRQLRAILNKLNPQNFDKLFEQVKEVNIDNAATLIGVISQFFDKALVEPTFCEMWANFCCLLADELRDFGEDNEKVTFRILLWNKCREELERGKREQTEANGVEEDDEIKWTKAEREEKKTQARRRRLGYFRLIGELFKKKLLFLRIMHGHIKMLLGEYEDPDEEDIEALCMLMSTIGEMIDHPKAKERMDAYFDMMTKLSNNMTLSFGVRFMLKDTIDLRKNKWQQRRKGKGQEKMEEVHRDASQEGIQPNNLDADQWERATGIEKGVIPSLKLSQVIHKAEKKYEVGKVCNMEEAKQRQLRAILNKLTPQNFDKYFELVKEVYINNVITLAGFISQIYDRALIEPTFCEIYANFCYRLAVELPDFSVDNEKITFKKLILNKCQEEFEGGERQKAETNRDEEEGEIKCSEKETEEKKTQTRKRMLGNIRLIGEFYKKRMLTEKIMHECIKKLLGQYQNPEGEDIEGLCKLMSTVGEMIDHPKAKERLNAYFEMMEQLSNNVKLSYRVRLMLKDVIDLRKNKWQQKRTVEGPKKIEEIHRAAAQERQQANRLGCGSVVRFDLGRSTMLSSPYAQMGGLSSQVRGYGAQDVGLEDRNSYKSRTLPVPVLRRPIEDDSITLAPQGGLARRMSFGGQPPLSSVSVADISLSPGDAQRTAAGANGYSSMSELALFLGAIYLFYLFLFLFCFL